MSKLKQHIEFLTNVAIIVVAVALCTVLVKQYFLAGPTPPAQQRPAVGAKIALPGVDLAAQDKTLLLVLQKGCHYCSESAPFYQRLAREAADKAGQVKVV